MYLEANRHVVQMVVRSWSSLYCFSRRSIVEPLDNKKWQPTIRRIDLFGKKARHRIANRPISPLGTFLPTFSTRFYMRGVR